jgi:hypothetical protein
MKARTASVARKSSRTVTPKRNISTIQADTIDALCALSTGDHGTICLAITAPLNTERYVKDVMMAMARSGTLKAKDISNISLRTMFVRYAKAILTALAILNT